MGDVTGKRVWGVACPWFSRLRSGVAASVAGGCLVAGLVVSPAWADQGPIRPFVATAEARGGSLYYGIPGFLAVSDFIDGGGPVAQSVLDAVGTSQSFASLPYPGSTAIGFPGVAALFLGSAPPGYPFYASAQYPTTPSQTVADPLGSYSLSASADAGRALGDARVGSPGGENSGARALTDVVFTGGRVTATAASTMNGLRIGPLTVASIESKSVSVYEAGAEKAETGSVLRIEGGRVGDMSFAFGPEGLAVADQGVPLPWGEGLGALNQALAPSGLSLRFVAPSPVEGGTGAAVFEVVSVAPVPGAGTGTFRLRFGGARTSIVLGETAEGAAEEGSVSPPAEPRHTRRTPMMTSLRVGA